MLRNPQVLHELALVQAILTTFELDADIVPQYNASQPSKKDEHGQRMVSLPMVSARMPGFALNKASSYQLNIAA